MTNDQFIQQFGHFVEAPSGIQKLRELILQLAVQGKLVEQSSSDEPANVLLEKTVSKRAELIKDKTIRKTKAPALPDEIPRHEIPSTWVWTSLYEIGEIGPRNVADDEVDSSFVPMPLISDNYGAAVQHEVRPWKEIKSGFTHFKDEDVVLGKITPCFQNGKSAVMRGLTNGFGAGTTELHVYRAIYSCTVPEYVLIYLKSPGFIIEGIPKMTGTAGQKRITRDYFAGNHFPLPPLGEQHRIVAKVDELMALCDQLEAERNAREEIHQTLIRAVHHPLTEASDTTSTQTAWHRIWDNFADLYTTLESVQTLRQTILQLAVQGKLVPQDPNDEAVHALVDVIKNEKKQKIAEKKIKKEKPFPEISGIDEIKSSIPSHWSWLHLNDIASIVRGGSPRPAGDPRFYGGNIPFLKVGDITSSKGKMVDGYAHTITKAGLHKTRLISDATVLLTNSGATLGVPAICDFATTFNDGIAAFIFLTNHVEKEYLYLYLKSKSKWFLEFASRGQGQPNLNTDIIRATWFPLPPINEQRRIVTKVDDLMNICDQLEANIREKNHIATNYTEAVVHQIAAA
ncbi:MAG: restriction endonuclease subunit S [Candidatus Sedimenticola sp. 6PFRAG7]